MINEITKIWRKIEELKKKNEKIKIKKIKNKETENFQLKS